MKKLLNTKKKVALAILLVAAVLLGIYFGLSLFFRSHFMFGTTINRLGCSGRSVERVKEELQDHIMEYELTLKERDDQTEVISAGQLGLKYVDDNGVEQLLEEQNPFSWIAALFRGNDYQVSANTQYDKSTVDEILNGLTCFQENHVTAPADAVIEETDDGFVITPEVQGNTLKRDQVKQAVIDAVDAGRTELDLEELDLYEKPSVLSTDEGLNAELQQLNTITTAQITYDFVDRQFTVDRSVIREWLVKDENGDYVLDQDQAAAWVKHMAYETDTFGLEHTFQTSLGPTITLAAGGDYGWVINKDETTQQLIDNINAGTQGNLEPVYVYTAMDRSSNDIGGTYVEVCIQEQKMWCYKDGQLVVETPVVTGNSATGHDTPSGSVWAIDAKKKDAHFKQFNVDVTFWLPFNGGVGIHDASWRSSSEYVPSTFRSNGSHGCVNTPYDAAEQIFNTVDIGYPVIVYYSTDQVVGPQPTQENTIG
ncbi:L,D-transpeptidase family protein [Ruminococcus gauvreauii]|uniref:L,D-transpeptidase/peptidoglycan binding protein n=1 Tax=Ruminococcus gauvreauii TaxID=438033 RepID=A0ABY5VK59_9FIRM|nr:L,D-transpeptidase family protein [Ruminococcus gauvreauii]UWP59913.1 L,D-transpeptidase/peptidoglycan binding protein [Ruminococcus gauvreauii]